MRGARGEVDRDMDKTGAPGGGADPAFALPGIQTDVVMIAASSEEGRFFTGIRCFSLNPSTPQKKVC